MVNLIELIKDSEKFTAPKNRGARPAFDYIDVILALRIIGKFVFISRKKLAEELELGEGSIRTLIKKLKEFGYIKVVKSGITLTDKGNEYFKEIDNIIKSEFFIPYEKLNNLAIDKINFCLIAKHISNKVGKGIEERDVALKYNTKGLITIVYKNKNLFFADGFPLEEVYKNFTEYLKNNVKLEEGDLIMIASSSSKTKTIKGAYSALIYLLTK